jgi:hypothetical protein
LIHQNEQPHVVASSTKETCHGSQYRRVLGPSRTGDDIAQAVGAWICAAICCASSCDGRDVASTIRS